MKDYLVEPISARTENQENSIEKTFETRKRMIEILRNKLEANSKVVAAFLAGADAHDSVDEYSDIDFDIVTTPDSIEEVEKIVTEALEEVAPIINKTRVVMGGGVTLIHQFDNISKFLTVDVLIMTNADKINKSEVKILFDKNDVIREDKGLKAENDDKIRKRVESIEKNIGLREVYVERALNRGNYLEAEDKYRDLVLKMLVEALRLKYCPEKSSYHMKHIYKDLPEAVVTEIEDLTRVSTIEELKQKSLKASELLNQVLSELKDARG